MKKVLALCVVMLGTLCMQAQVKIGNNPDNMDSNALLEMETTNKGLLAPRIAINDVNSASPLIAPVTAGMIVYSQGGTVANGFYFWNGSQWLQVQSSANQRSNYVLVKSAADLPAPVGGVITLVAGTTYEVNGTITLTSKINLNGCYLVGQDANNDKLVYTPATGELFTGTKGGTIKTLTMVASSTGAKLFNLNMGSTDQLLLRDAIVGNTKDIGVIQGGNLIFFSVVSFSGNTSGITFQNCYNVLLDNTAWFSNNSGTYEKFVGTFNMIKKQGGFFHALSANSATGMDITGITSITEAGDLKNTAFVGNGTKVNGTFSKVWEVEGAGLTTEKDAVATGSLYLTTSNTTSIGSKDVAVKISGTTQTTELARFTSPTNNRLQYDGTKTRTFLVTATISATGTSGTYAYSFYIFKNGTKITSSRQKTKVYSSSGDIQVIALSCSVTLSPGDYVEVYTENNESNVNMITQFMNLTIK